MGETSTHLGYRRGAIMGLTVAEAFILLAFCLLLLFTWWQADAEEKAKEVAAAQKDGSLDLAREIRDAGLLPNTPEAAIDLKNHVRFLSEQDVQRLMRG